MLKKAISVQAVSKEYRLYKRSFQRVLSLFFPSGKIPCQVFSAVKNVDMEVNRGESIGIIGRNGSGKSTMLQLVCGILKPTTGSVEIDGRISALLELGAGFNPEFSGRENVYLSTSIMGLSKEETDSRFGKIVKFADINEFIDHPVKTYSSGMFVRLAFATAISVDPDILIVDEALAVGDIFFQQKCMKYMRKVMEVNTIILVSHDMHAVSSLCDRVIVMEGGEKIFDGATAEGISLYTRLVHNELFDRKKKQQVAGDFPESVASAITAKVEDFHDWLQVDSKSLGGADEVSIKNVSVTRNSEIFKTIEPGEMVTVRMLLLAKRAVKDVIIGYTIKDRVGIAVFGENSVCLKEELPGLQLGYSLVAFEFCWPEVDPQEYTLTLGIGEGTHPFDHTIQCWAHNVVSIVAVTPGRFLHGIFNNPITSVNLTPVG